MLCESRLWSMTYGELEEVEARPPVKARQSTTSSGLQRAAAALMPASTSHSPGIHHHPPEQIGNKDCLQLPGLTHGPRPYERSASVQLHISSLRALDLQRAQPGRQISPEIEIPVQACSGGDVPFLVPSFCQSICQNYSDLHIGGDQVLPLSANDGELRLCTENQAVGPFLQSCDVPPAVEDSPPEQISQGGPLCPLRGGSTRWRQGSGRDRSFLFQGCEGPFSNSLLNRYLEHKLLDLYQQYMLENMAREGDSGCGPSCPLLGSELVLTSLDQITLQLSREGNLEAGLAKDMVLSCLLRVAGDMQSSEISTPFLQISNEASRDQATDDMEK
ncbi:TLR adapter interacting with SLC15A4 on the lysosome [Diretmus argenteus]